MGDNPIGIAATSEQRSDYYDLFDKLTDGGRVFIDDLSAEEVTPKKLSDKEVKARKKYEETVRELYQAYRTTNPPIAASREEVLHLRVVATCLGFTNVSSRSARDEHRAGRIYPKQIHPWVEFDEQVRIFKGDTTELNSTIERYFWHSLWQAKNKVSNEAGEQQRLVDSLTDTLLEARMVHAIGKPTKKGFKGQPDFCVMRDDNIVSIICECKSTHNLLLPMSADDCTRAYNRAYAHGLVRNTRSLEWSNVAHPIGQLLCYMVDNKHRYGALTSGTRTYFVTLRPEENVSTSSKIQQEGQVPGCDENRVITRSQARKRKTNDVAERHCSHDQKRNVGFKFVRAVQYLWSGSTSQKAKTDQNRKVGDQKRNVAKTDQNRKLGAPKPRVYQDQCNKPADSHDACDEATNTIGIKVYISDAWCVGQANYLRAWAYMHNLHGSDDGPWRYPTDWIKSTTSQDTPINWKEKKNISGRSPGNDNDNESNSLSDARDSGYDHSGKSANSCNMEYFFPLHQGALELTPLDEIEIMGVIGYGRNGDCFKVKWNGTEYAMKQFDIGRDGDTYFSKEIYAYMLLQNAWGVLVPRPIFLSESFSGAIMFLGLQLGCESMNDDDSQKFEKVLEQIETEYGIRHNDTDRGRNMITITDGNGVARVVAIDFEDWDEVSVDSSRAARH